jgi:hypothetical protein
MKIKAGTVVYIKATVKPIYREGNMIRCITSDNIEIRRALKPFCVSAISHHNNFIVFNFLCAHIVHNH